MVSVVLELDTSDYDAKMPPFQRALSRIPGRWIQEGAEIYESQMKIEIPKGGSGKLENSVDSIVTDKEAVISTNTGYGKAVDEGRRGFKVVAKRARALRFVIGTQVFYRKSANVGPARANRFIPRTLQNARPRILSMMRTVFNEEMAGVR